MPVIRRVLWLALLAGVSGGCGGGGVVPPGPVAGSLRLALSGAGATDGAILLRITGGPVSAVTGSAPYLANGASAGDGYRIVVSGDLANGTVASIQVPDVNGVGAYVVVIEQVADRHTFALLDPAGRRVTVAR